MSVQDLQLSADDLAALRTKDEREREGETTTPDTQLLRLNEHLYESFQNFLDAIDIDQFSEDDEDDGDGLDVEDEEKVEDAPRGDEIPVDVDANIEQVMTRISAARVV